VSATVFKSAGRPRVIDRAVYGTIVITSTLVVYDGWANLRVLGAIAVILGPVVAMVIGHMFAASLAAYAELRRRSTKRELLRILRGRGIALGVLAGFAAGGAVLLVQVFLQPGVAVTNGVAAIQLGYWPVA
jgi:hypothetical protein